MIDRSIDHVDFFAIFNVTHPSGRETTGTEKSLVKYTFYRGEKKGLQILLSYSRAGPGRKAKQGQEEISRNLVQTF